jgi:Zn-dependent protease with chaperone function
MITSRNFSASYFDGKSARKFTADVAVSQQGLLVSISGAEARLWPYGSLRLAQGDQNPPLHLEHLVAGGDETCPEILVVDHPDFPLVLQEADPSVLKLPPRSAIGRITRLLTLSCLSLLLLVLGFKYAGPVLVDGMVKIFPYSWEKKLGDKILIELQPKNYHPPSQEKLQALESIINQLQTGTTNPAGYAIRVHVFPHMIVNALALPGGNIIVFQGLLNIAETPEELAGVLAHEMQHILLRHATRNLAREMAVKLFFFLMAGELSNKALQVAESLVSLRYSREMEAEADREGMKTVIAGGIDPAGMVQIFEKLAAHEGKSALDFDDKKPEVANSSESPSWMKYLSTHPAGKDRVNELQGLASKRDKSSPIKPLLPGMDWTGMHSWKISAK